MQAFKEGYKRGRANNRNRFFVPPILPQINEKKVLSTSTMPQQGKRTWTRTTTRRRNNNRRRKLIRYRRAPVLQPKSIIRKLKTQFVTTLDPSAGVVDRKVLALNSAHQPGGAGVASSVSTTQQALGHDQYATLYKRYCVVGWKVRVEYATTDNSYAVMAGFTPSLSDTALTSAGYYKECKGTRSTILTPDVDKAQLFARGTVKQWLAPKGGKILSIEDLSGSVSTGGGTNPSDILYGHLWLQAFNGGVDPGTVYLSVTLEQLVVYYDPIIPARSTVAT